MKFSQLALFLLLPLFLLVITNRASAQEKSINWVSIEQAQELSKESPKKIFMDIYTDWCGWCKRMDATTFSHPVIVDYINENFYAVKLNAEQSEPISFRGQVFVNENPGGRRSAHNFAVAVLQGKMGYPSFAFFDEDLNLVHAFSGFRPPESLEPILVFFNDEIYKTEPDLDKFIKEFQGQVTN
jgi:thioredoxin-related protein